MGSFVDAAVSAGKDLLDTSGIKDDVVHLWTRLRPMQNEFEKSEAGKDLLGVTKNYIQNYQRALQGGIDNANKLPKDLQPHPLILAHQARNVARSVTFGENDAVGAYLLHQATKTPNMDEAAAHMHAQNMADFVSSILHDTETRPTWRKLTAQEQRMEDSETAIKNVGRIKDEESLLKTRKSTIAGTSAPFSTFKANVSQNKETPVKLKLYPTYTPTTALEANLMHYAQKVVYPLVILPHLGTVVNNAISTPLNDLAKAAAEQIKLGDGTEVQKIQDFAHRAGVFASTSYDVYAANYYGSHGIISSMTNDTVGKAVYKMTHNPGFDAARRWQLAFTASAGYHTAQEMAQRLLKNPKDARAIYEFGKMGINPSDVLINKGNLTPEMTEKAIWRFVDNKVFLETNLQRAYISRQHPMLRVALMYHSYVSREAQLLRNEFSGMIKSGDFYHLFPQFVAAVGVAFPLVGLMTKNITTLARGDWSDVHPKQDIQDLIGENGPKAFFNQLLEDYMHTAAFGIATSYLRGGTRFSTANAMLGPLGNIAARVGDDTIHPASQIWQGKDPNLKPLGRDVLEYNPLAVDNLGKLAAHYILPTKKEEELRNPKASMKFKRDKKNRLPSFKKFN